MKAFIVPKVKCISFPLRKYHFMGHLHIIRLIIVDNPGHPSINHSLEDRLNTQGEESSTQGILMQDACNHSASTYVGRRPTLSRQSHSLQDASPQVDVNTIVRKSSASSAIVSQRMTRVLTTVVSISCSSSGNLQASLKMQFLVPLGTFSLLGGAGQR